MHFRAAFGGVLNRGGQLPPSRQLPRHFPISPSFHCRKMKNQYPVGGNSRSSRMDCTDGTIPYGGSPDSSDTSHFQPGGREDALSRTILSGVSGSRGHTRSRIGARLPGRHTGRTPHAVVADGSAGGSLAVHSSVTVRCSAWASTSLTAGSPWELFWTDDAPPPQTARTVPTPAMTHRR